MDIPEPVQDVGWHKFGSAPGARSGSAVPAGHVDRARQGRGALLELQGVDIGAKIDVTLASGRVVHYRVTGRETFVKKRLPTERLFAREGPPRLVIITCGGPFIKELSSHRDNLVVAAEPLTWAARRVYRPAFNGWFRPPPCAQSAVQVRVGVPVGPVAVNPKVATPPAPNDPL